VVLKPRVEARLQYIRHPEARTDFFCRRSSNHALGDAQGVTNALGVDIG
jgi:hypothetical protein